MTIQQSDKVDPFFNLDTFIKVVKKKRKLLYPLFTLLVCLTIIYNIQRKNVYEASFTVYTSDIYIDAKALNKNFKIFCSNNQKLKTSKDLKELKDLDIQTSTDAIENKTSYNVKIQVYNTKAINQIVKHFVQFCNNNPYLIFKLNMEKEKISETQNAYQTQLDSILLLKRKIIGNNHHSATNMYYNIFKDIATIQEKIIELDFKMREKKGFILSLPPTISIQPIGLGVIPTLLIAIPIELIFCMFLTFYLDKFLTILKK